MVTKKHDIDKLKFAVLFVISWAESLLQKLEDKKLTWGERLALIVELRPVLEIVKNWREMKDEVLDLDEEETQEIISIVQLELDLSSEESKKKVIASLKVLAAIFELIQAF